MLRRKTMEEKFTTNGNIKDYPMYLNPSAIYIDLKTDAVLHGVDAWVCVDAGCLNAQWNCVNANKNINITRKHQTIKHRPHVTYGASLICMTVYVCWLSHTLFLCNVTDGLILRPNLNWKEM